MIGVACVENQHYGTLILIFQLVSHPYEVTHIFGTVFIHTAHVARPSIDND